jgi:hypothetical protein
MQRQTGHSGNAMLVARAITTSDRKCLKRGILKGFWGPFGFFCMECRRSLLITVRLWAYDSYFSNNVDVPAQNNNFNASTQLILQTMKPQNAPYSIFHNEHIKNYNGTKKNLH